MMRHIVKRVGLALAFVAAVELMAVPAVWAGGRGYYGGRHHSHYGWSRSSYSSRADDRYWENWHRQNQSPPYWEQPSYWARNQGYSSSGYSYTSYDRYGAIAYSRSTGKSAYSWGHASQSAAEQSALSHCTADDAEVVMWMRNAYGALAVGDDLSQYGWAWSADRATAEQQALEKCRSKTTNCRIAVTVFSGN